MSAAIDAASGTRDGAAHGRICEAIHDSGMAVETSFIANLEVAALAEEARRRDAGGEFHDARVGRAASRTLAGDIRGDRILWLDEGSPAPVEMPLWSALTGLRDALNRALFLGLFSIEAHYSIYPAGTRYRRHRDRFRDDDRRILSCVIYLNEAWQSSDGGELRVYCDDCGNDGGDDGGDDGARDIVPAGGTLACFLSERFEHEVLPATRDRIAVAAWFLRRP